MNHHVKFAALAALSVFSINSNAALTGYSANGVDLVYSSVSNITWTKDANLLGSLIADQGYAAIVDAIIAASPVISDTPNSFDTPPYSGVHNVSAADFSSSDLGQTSWFGAKAFANYLNSIKYAGSDDWSLPGDVGGYSQFSQLFSSELGGQHGSDIPNTDTFINEQAYLYWLNKEDANADWAEYFVTTSPGGGSEVPFNKTFPMYAWAVTPGIVTPVPLPSAFLLMGSGLLGLFRWRRTAAC